MWITGGKKSFSRNDVFLKSTDLVTLLKEESCSLSAIKGPDLPMKVYHHCLAKLNSTTGIMVGGINPAHQSTYILDIPGSNYQPGAKYTALQGPDLNTGRYDHNCGVLSNPGDGNEKQLIIVTGGMSIAGRRLKSTEIWAVDLSQSWKFGPDLPVGVNAAAGVASQDGKSFLLVGGFRDDASTGSRSIFRLEYPWKWTELDQKLQVLRKDVVAMLVPDSFC